MGKTRTNLRKADPAEVRQFALELRATGQARRLEGVVAPYGEKWDVGGFTETIRPGAFKKSINEAPGPIPLMVAHDYSGPSVAKAVEWRETDTGLVGVFEFDTRADAEETARQAEAGFLSGLSVGFIGVRSEWDTVAEPPHVERLEAALREVSLTAVPAFPSARVVAVRSAGCPEVPGLDVAPKLTPRLDAAMRMLERLRAVR